MAIVTALRNFIMGDPSEVDDTSVTHVSSNTERPKHDDNGNEYPQSDTSEKHDEIDNAQRGVQNIQATTMAWTKTSLATLLILYGFTQITTL